MTISPIFPPILLTENTVKDISYLLEGRNVVVLYNHNMYRAFHSIPDLLSTKKPLAKTRVIYLDCHSLNMSNWNGESSLFGEKTLEISKETRLWQRIQEKTTIPHKETFILD
jgi:hypothetical protein